MLEQLAAAYPQVVNATFAEASSLLNYDLWELIQHGPQAELDRTQFTQPAMLASGVAAWRVWVSLGAPRPHAMAGHSLGEFSALVAANALDLAQATKLVSLRGEIMQGAVAVGVGAVAAILGLETDAVAAACTRAAQGQIVEPVNFNAPNQTVIAGHAEAVERAMQEAKSSGAKRAVLLPVSVPVHSSLMSGAAQQFAEEIDRLEIRMPEVPVVQNLAATAYESLEEVRSALRRHLDSGVRWSESVLAMRTMAGNTFIEFGPGKVLAGLCKRIDRSLTAGAADSPDSIDAALAMLQA
jgi:[acyl-carrier-protein] S-malonyltransferase